MNDPSNKIELWLQYLEALRAAAYTSFNDRRSYEWKLSLAIWTALAVLIAGLLQPLKTGEPFPLRGGDYVWVAAGVGVLIVLLHIFFNNGMARANGIDRIKGRIYEDQIESVLNFVPTKNYQKEKDELDRLIGLRPDPPKWRATQWWQWGHLAQIGITALLASTAVAIFWVRAAH